MYSHQNKNRTYSLTCLLCVTERTGSGDTSYFTGDKNND